MDFLSPINITQKEANELCDELKRHPRAAEMFTARGFLRRDASIAEFYPEAVAEADEILEGYSRSCELS